MRTVRTFAMMSACAGLVAATLAAPAPASAATWETLLDGSSFQDRTALIAEWNFRYPWGSDHNGSARMYAGATDNSQVYLPSPGVLTIKASRISGSEGTSSSTPYLPIHYHSGAIHAKDQITVNDQFPSYEVRGEFQAPSAPGTWPAFWLTGATSWPPESDILEFKGDTRNWFNTYKNASGGWSSTPVTVSSPGGWHQYRVWISKVNATDVDIHYYLDGVWKAQHRGANFVGKPMWLILNLQMEGSSGGTGPAGDTFYSARNISIGRNRAF
ncbi:family 16 glycosylhydrolase [Actinoplanes sp. NPDC051494]|uniref:family 16 glycosylhydrolase n=1 Tax=Actinoplanes sp. NPDC051494 TaxID=3363907 RepID=UPI00379A3C55